jgi:hypothetical protein
MRPYIFYLYLSLEIRPFEEVIQKYLICSYVARRKFLKENRHLQKLENRWQTEHKIHTISLYIKFFRSPLDTNKYRSFI